MKTTIDDSIYGSAHSHPGSDSESLRLLYTRLATVTRLRLTSQYKILVQTIKNGTLPKVQPQYAEELNNQDFSLIQEKKSSTYYSLYYSNFPFYSYCSYFFKLVLLFLIVQIVLPVYSLYSFGSFGSFDAY